MQMFSNQPIIMFNNQNVSIIWNNCDYYFCKTIYVNVMISNEIGLASRLDTYMTPRGLYEDIFIFSIQVTQKSYV